MLENFSATQSCYCAFCRTPRRIYKKKRISLVNVVASLIGAVVMMIAIFQEFDPRFFLFFVFFLAVAETFIQIRWRMSMSCRECGFDPVMYLKNPDIVVEKVKLRLSDREKDPVSLLKPALQLPKISSKRIQEIDQIRAAQPAKKGSVFSQRV